MDKKRQDTKCDIFINIETEGDSILDFKSPESKITKTKLSEFVKPMNIKQKRKATTKLKNQEDAKSEKRIFQPFTKSSYFQAKNNDDNNDLITKKVALVCPLCFKTFKDVDSQAAHMKICACKNNISTKKLLDAIELQKRQEDERKLLGLLAAPIVQEKKKSVARKVNSFVDSDFNLALALSKSLQEAEEFVNAKPATLVKNRKRIHNVVTVLETRTQKERNRILTEKIADILMGDEPFTQKLKKEITRDKKFTVKTDLRSCLLQDLFYESKKLWDKAELPQSEISFYVPNLSEYIFPQEQQAKGCEEHNREPSKDKTEKSMDEKTFYKMSQNDLHLINEKCENCTDKHYIDSVLNNWRNVLNDSSASDTIVFVDNNKYIWAHKLVFYVQCSNILLDVMPNDNLQFATVKEKICWPDIPYNVALAFLEFIYSGNIKKYFNICKDVRSFSALRNLARKYKVTELFAYLQRTEAETKQQAKLQTEHIKDNVHGRILNVEEDDNLKEYSSISKGSLCKKKEEYKESLHTDEQSSEEYLEGILNNSESLQTGRKSLVLPGTSTLSVKATDTRQISSIRQCNESPDMFDDTNDSIRSYNEKSVNHTIGTNKSQRSNNTDIDIASTPQSSRPTQRSRKKSDIKRIKSNLSLFIDQFRAENAKSDFDTDSDSTTMATRVSSNLRRNPFNLESDNSDQNFIFNETIAGKGKSGIEIDVLNKFDHVVTSFPLHLHTTTEETDINVNLAFDSMDNLTQSLENNEGIYIQKSTKSNSTNSNITSAEGTIQNVNSSIEKCNESDSNVLPDSHFDDGELSMYTKYKKTHQNNSIVRYRNFPEKYLLNNSVKTYSENDYCEAKNNVDMEDIPILTDEDTDVEIDSEFTLILENGKEDKASGLEKSTLSFSPCSTNVNKTLDNEHEKTVNSNKLRYAKSESNIDTERKRNNLSVSSPEQKTNRLNLTESPVLIFSSPEIDFVTSNIDTYKKVVANKVSNLYEFHDNTHIFEKDIYLANVRINDDNSDGRTIKETSIIESSGKNGEPTTTDNHSMSQSTKPLVTAKNNRKFKRKSMSEKNLNANRKNKKDGNNVTSLPFDSVNWSLCNCGSKQVLRKVKSPMITRDSCTPPPDYNGMETPELHAELHRYGLKLHKRSRAVKLLTHIYNELHPTIPLTSKKVESELVVINSDDEEPIKRRRSYSEDDNNSDNEYSYGLPSLQDSTEKSHENETLTASATATATATVTTSAPNIKDVFLELIKDHKELYNNILSYEPLCINSVYSMLKGKGFKYKMSTLMDFLDEQCITFYLKDTKQSRKLAEVNDNTKRINKM